MIHALRRRVWSCRVALAATALLLSFAGCERAVHTDAAALTGGNPTRGLETFHKYGCVTCHTIPGVTGADGLVGPPLARLGARVYLAGRLPNTPENLIRWIRHPQQVAPGNVMPEMGVSDRDARDMAAYLYTLQ